MNINKNSESLAYKPSSLTKSALVSDAYSSRKNVHLATLDGTMGV